MENRKKGMSHRGLLICGMVFASMGALGLSLGRRFQLNMAGSAMEAPAAIQTAVLLLLMFSMAAIPIFATLLVEGFGEGEHFRDTVIGLGLLAVISEIPYNLTMTGGLFSLTAQNPVFALLICEVQLWVYNRFGSKGFKSLLVALVTTLAGIMLCRFLGLMEYGLPLMLATLVMWFFRRSNGTRTMAALLGSLACALMGIAYLTAPIGVLAVHFSTGEPSEKKCLGCYLIYPAALLLSYFVSLAF